MANCENCKTETVPLAALECEVARSERQFRRMLVALFLVIVLMFASNAAWLYAWSQYDYESYEISADGDSNANYIGQDGNIYNGSENFSEKTQEEKER